MKTTTSRNQELQKKAMSLLQQGRPQEALTIAIKACKRQPSNADAWMLRAAIHAQLHEYADIIQCCEKALHIQPGNALAAFNLGLAYQYLGRLDDAREAYQKAAALNPGYSAAKINLSAVLTSLGDTTAALQYAEDALETTPENPAAHIAKGRALLKHGKAQDALNVFTTALQCFNHNPDIEYQIALCHKAMGNKSLAQDLLIQLTHTNPDHASAWAELGNFERQAEHFNQAAQYYDRASRLQPTLENRFNLAHCLYAADQVEPARKLYRTLLEQAPNNLLILNNLGRLYERIGDFSNAESLYRKALSLQPDQAVPYANLGRILLNQERYSDAKQAFSQAIAIDPEDFQAHFGLGQTLCELGHTQAAIEAFRQSANLKEELIEAHHYIASLSGETNNDVQQRYVADLFDRFADKFENHLVNNLKYDIPNILWKTINSLSITNKTDHKILDLGCGTGLCAPLFRPIAKHLAGIDLSSKMIDKARELNLYDELAVDDATAFMIKSPQCYDIIIAADVFVYIGDMVEPFKAAYNSLCKGGLFAFSMETWNGKGYKLRKSGRHAHSNNYIQELASSTGFMIEAQSDCNIRLELNKPIPGTVYVLRKPNTKHH